VLFKAVDKVKVSIYIKSQFRGNPRGAGEAAAIIEFVSGSGKTHSRKHRIEINNDTKNALYLKICIHSLRSLLKPCEAVIFTDCEYIKNAYCMGWLEKWRQEGWKRATGKQPANVEEWKQFYMLTQIHKVRFEPCGSRYDAELDNLLKGGNND
jgi:Ribonuclease HI